MITAVRILIFCFLCFNSSIFCSDPISRNRDTVFGDPVVQAKVGYDAPVVHYLAAGGDGKALGFLLKHDPSMAHQRHKGRTPLHIAAGFGNIAAAQTLLDAGAHVDECVLVKHCAGMSYEHETVEETPLAIAAQNNQLYMVNFLLTHGADINGSKSRYSPFYTAALGADFKGAAALVTLGARINDPRDKGVLSDSFCLCSSWEDVYIRASFLIGMGIDPNETGSYRGTPLLDLCRRLIDFSENTGDEYSENNGEEYIAEAAHTLERFVGLGCNPNMRDYFSNGDIFKGVIRNESVFDVVSNRCWFAASVPIMINRVPLAIILMRQLMRMGSGPTRAGYDRLSPIVQEYIKMVWEDGQKERDGELADVSESAWDLYVNGAACLAKYKKTGNIADVPIIPEALVVAVQIKDVPLVVHLLDQGLKMEDQSFCGIPPLHLAAQSAQVELLRLAREHGANLAAVDIYGNTMMHYAADTASVELFCLARECGIDANQEDITGFTALHKAAREGNLEVVRCLMEQCGAVDGPEKGYERDLALHIAARHKHLPIVRYLIEVQGADVNAQNLSRQTPLRCAGADVLPCNGKRGSVDLVRYLVGRGARLDENGDGAAILSLATKYKHNDMIKYLTEECGLSPVT